MLGVVFSSGPQRELQVLGDSLEDTRIAKASLHVTAVACRFLMHCIACLTTGKPLYMQVPSQKVSGCLTLITCDIKESRHAGWCLALSKLSGGLLLGLSLLSPKAAFLPIVLKQHKPYYCTLIFCTCCMQHSIHSRQGQWATLVHAHLLGIIGIPSKTCSNIHQPA